MQAARDGQRVFSKTLVVWGLDLKKFNLQDLLACRPNKAHHRALQALDGYHSGEHLSAI